MIQGWMSEVEQKWLAMQAHEFRVIIEIGCWKGLSTSILCEHTKGTVFTIDSWQQRHHAYNNDYTEKGRDGVITECKRNLQQFIEAGRLFILEMDSIAALEIVLPILLKHRQADMIFIDGNHDPQHVRKEVILSRNHCKMVCGHDYPEVMNGLLDFEHEVVVDGIWRLV